MKINEVYKKYEDFDSILNDLERLRLGNKHAWILYDLWQAVKESEETREAKVKEIISKVSDYASYRREMNDYERIGGFDREVDQLSKKNEKILWKIRQALEEL